jgi:catechol 2,3-dioxygenase-like lactoylglutathione lyase family enzyme
MLGSAKLDAFVATTDVAAARSFYAETLGLRLVDDNEFALVFDANGTTVRVTRVEQAVVAPYTVLGWQVADIGATVTALTTRGVVFHRYPGLEQDAAGIWSAPGGALVAWFPDPEGNTLSVSQPAGA